MKWFAFSASLLLLLFAENVSSEGVMTNTQQVVSSKSGSYAAYWFSGSNVNVCTDSTATMACIVGKMPITDVKKVVPGKYVAPSKASWLAFTDEKAFLCAMERWSSNVRCEMLSVPAFEGVELEFRWNEANRGAQLVFKFPFA
jgi:hypothetical protein